MEELDVITKKHELKMIELEYIRKTEELKHEWEKERMRIKSAEIRKNDERKYWNNTSKR